MRYNTITHLSALSILGLLVLAGCQASASVKPPPTRTETVTTETTVVRPDPLHAQSERLEDYAAAVQNAPDAIAEATALERLRRYERDHNLTYTVNTVRLDNG